MCFPLYNAGVFSGIQVREHGLTITPVVRSRNIGFANVVWVHPNHFKNDWVEAISSALIAADMTGFHSVSMPALGTGWAMSSSCIVYFSLFRVIYIDREECRLVHCTILI